MKDLLLETQVARQNLRQFYDSHYAEMSLLLPHPLSPWVFTPIEESIDKVFVPMSKGKEPKNEEFFLVIESLSRYQKNLKKLLGYETEAKLEDVYPFT